MTGTTTKLTIKETLDMYDYADAVIQKLTEHKGDDGKIDGGEVTSTLASTLPQAVKAIVGSGEVKAEMGDLDEEELLIIATRGAALAQALVSLFVE
jgi:hypothetical protein